MRIWLVTIGDPLPTDEGPPRLLRHGMLAETLVDRGHEVLWWTSSFDHARKLQRSADQRLVSVQPGLTLRLLPALGYRKSRSLMRFLDHYVLARRFAREARQATPPDLILASYPPVELCWEAARFGRSLKLPVVLDLRDAWPDIFLDYVPRWARLAVRWALYPLFVLGHRSRAQATAILGVTPGYVTWGVEGGGRKTGPLDRAFPLACSDQSGALADQERANKFWDTAGILADDDALTVCFFGTLAGNLEIDVVLTAAQRLEAENARIRFVICGTGDLYSRHKAAADRCGNVLMPGWVGMAEIRELMRRSQVGLAPYRTNWYFGMSIPNKVIEYLSGGLAVVSCLKGSVSDLLRDSECGLSYENENADNLISVLRELERDPERRKQMASNARRAFLESFSAEKVYAEMAEHLEHISAHADSTAVEPATAFQSPGSLRSL